MNLDLVGAIVNAFETGTGSAHDALFALTSGHGACIADFDYANVPPPYIIVSDKQKRVISQGTNNSYRIEEHTIYFECYADTRGVAVSLAEAVEAYYLDLLLEVSGYTVLNVPLLDVPAISGYDNPDRYSSTLGLCYKLSKSNF